MNTSPVIERNMSRHVREVFVSVPQKYMGRIIGTGGSNVKQIALETRTTIKTCNGQNFGEGPGFLVTGTAHDCEAAEEAIQSYISTPAPVMQRNISRRAEVFVPTPQKFMGRIIGTGGSNIKKIAQETRTIIKTCNDEKFGKGPGFLVIGTPHDCEDAERAIESCIQKREGQKLDIPKEYMDIVLGSGRKNIEKIETKTRTTILVPPREAQNGETVQLKIIGQPRNCDEAKARVRQRIAFEKQKTLRHEFGGDKHFVSFAFENENETFRLKPCDSAPVLDDFIQRQRYRIETELDNGDDDDDDDYMQKEISDETISDIKDQLRTPLQNLSTLKEEKQLLADLWCHFGKAFVSCVDEELIKDTFTPTEVKRRIKKLTSQPMLQNQDDHWRVSFEEGINPEDINYSQLPKSKDGSHGILGLKLVHNQWRYDFGFTTPTCRSVRLKVWEGLPPGRDEPPVEVKNILREVFLQGMQDINAWLCYPSISVLRGEIIAPNLQYDCRMKLRAGSRYVTVQENDILEDDILSEYLSSCRLDRESHSMHLPDEEGHEIPEGFDCVFYREAKEIMYEATVDEETFVVIVLDENGWDSDSLEKREKKQFGIRVVMNSWSEAMLSSERHWNPEQILLKLKNYIDFLSSLQDYLF